MRIARWIAPLSLLALLATTATAPAQDAKVEFDDLPKAVKTTVKEKFPEAKIRGVSKEKNEENETVYEVEMMIKGKSVDIIITPKGEIEVTEEQIESEDLPKAVMASYKKEFPSSTIDKVEKVTDEDKKVTYEVFVKVGKKEPFEVLFSPNGKILKNGADAEKSETPKKEKKD